MRKKTKRSFWSSDNKKSIYNRTDYRSCYYQGKWQNKLIDIICKESGVQKSDYFHNAWKYSNNKHEHMPKKIYKFYSCMLHNFQCVENGNVFLNAPENLNDPFDCKWGINEKAFIKQYIVEYTVKNKMIQTGEITKESYNNIIASSSKEYDESRMWRNRPVDISSLLSERYVVNPEDKIYKIANEARIFYQANKIKDIGKDISICSFSALDIEELGKFVEMWSHYANNHTGFCVEYDLSDLNKENAIDISKMTVENKVIGSIFPCNYKSRLSKMPIKTMYKMTTGKALTTYQRLQYNQQKIKAYLDKSTSWSYEREWRLIIDREFCQIFNNLIPFPYISAIYLGCNMKQSDREAIYSIAQTKKITVFNGEIDKQKFEINFFPVNIDEYFKEKKYVLDNEIYTYTLNRD